MQFARPYIWHKPIKFKILMVLFVEGLVMLISPTLSHRQQTAATVLGSTSMFNTLTILKYKLSDFFESTRKYSSLLAFIVYNLHLIILSFSTENILQLRLDRVPVSVSE